MKIHHLAIAVKDLDQAIEAYQEALGVEPEIKTFEPHNLRWAIFPLGESEIQLCENIKELDEQEASELPEVATRYSSHIENFGEGFHHVALQVEDLSSTLDQMTSGMVTIAGQPITDAKPLIEPRARLVFLDDASMNGLRVEFIQITDESA